MESWKITKWLRNKWIRYLFGDVQKIIQDQFEIIQQQNRMILALTTEQHIIVTQYKENVASYENQIRNIVSHYGGELIDERVGRLEWILKKVTGPDLYQHHYSEAQKYMLLHGTFKEK